MECLEPFTDCDEQEVDADAFFGDIASRLMTRFHQAGTPAAIHVDAQIVDIPVTLAEHLGSIATELLNNACTHGRSADGSATAWLSFHIHRDLIHLAVEDDGPGLPSDLIAECEAISGLRRINALVQSHSGVVQATNTKGARLSIRIPRRPHPDSGGMTGLARDDLRARREAKRRGR